MKTALAIKFLAFATVLMLMSDAYAVQVKYKIEQRGQSGNLDFGVGESQPSYLNQIIDTDIARYQVTGSVNPSRVGLIGVSSGFTAAVAKELPGFTPDSGGMGDGGMIGDDQTGDDGPGDMFGWNRVTIDTSAVGSFTTMADINGLSESNNVGYVRFDWVITGISSILVDTDPGFGQFDVTEAVSIAKLDSGVDIIDTFAHFPPLGPDGSANDVKPGVLTQESFQVPFDFTQLAPGETPQLAVDFDFTVETRLNVTNTDGGGFVSIFDADFSNTATLTSVTVFDNSNNLLPATVVDSVTGQSLVASSVPEPSTAVLLALAGCAGFIRRRRCVSAA